MSETPNNFSVGSTDSLRRNFGFWYKQQRMDAGRTQAFVAEKTGLHIKHICRVEGGKSGVKRDTVVSLARAISIDENEALKFAGFGVNPGDSGIEFEVCDGVRLKFQQQDNWSVVDRFKVAEYLRLFILGMQNEQSRRTTAG